MANGSATRARWCSRRRPRDARVWSSLELRQLRELSDAGIGVEIIAARLHRSVSAVRNKAGLQGFSLKSIDSYLSGSSA
jgi:hypothetical protein